MSYKKTMIVLLAVLVASTALSRIEQRERVGWMGWDFQAVALDRQGGPSQIKMTYWATHRCQDCQEITVTIESLDGLDIDHAGSWTVSLAEDTLHETLIDIRIPKDTVSSFSWMLQANEKVYTGRVWFDAISDSVWWGTRSPGADPWGEGRHVTKRLSAFTPEQLAQLVHIKVDFNYGTKYERDTCMKILQGDLIPTSDPNVFYAKVSLRRVILLEFTGVWFEEVRDTTRLHPQPTPPPTRWRQRCSS